MDNAFWRSIATNNFQLPAPYTVEELVPELLAKLGEVDPELRDYYIYTTLENWILHGLCSQQLLRGMLTQLLANLQQGLGNTGDNTVLLRSFSALTISDILKYDNTNHFLAREEVLDILEQGITYFMREQDLRGYETGKGWIHALAHAGDLLAVLARNHHLGDANLERILMAVAEKVTVPTTYAYLTLEEERLALVVIAALTRKVIHPTFWSWWCQPMAQVEEPLQWENTVRFAQPPEIYAYHNTKMFLHSLYFQLTLAGYKLPGVQELIHAIIKTLNRLDPGFFSVDVMKIIDADINTDKLR
ncbi:hypothetical protein KDA_58430 [Dictyobacter alpinus]|uniref:DUF2785 domain-containing protein n=1 Tax=Dictyobacter alpinus TaxID=2014873 RepID=A0A402BGA6_9CHLR|nr:DUF2785 domain-containing protein [Dictyobacter alpinus]GCE30359.1 hypothetical protein KDA_58430 [Dictyobacter alpinus]